MSESSRNPEDWKAYLKQDAERALAELFVTYRDRLRSAVELRMDPLLHARIDPSDVLQETFVEAQRRLSDYLTDPDIPPYLWVRFLALQQVVTHYRKHVGAKARDARRERSLNAGTPEASSAALAARLVDDGTTPSQAISRAERQRHLQTAIEALDPMDREIIVLRHFEQLSNVEVSAVLDVKPATASQRYLRALARLKNALGSPSPSDP